MSDLRGALADRENVEVAWAGAVRGALAHNVPPERLVQITAEVAGVNLNGAPAERVVRTDTAQVKVAVATALACSEERVGVQVTHPPGPGVMGGEIEIRVRL